MLNKTWSRLGCKSVSHKSLSHQATDTRWLSKKSIRCCSKRSKREWQQTKISTRPAKTTLRRSVWCKTIWKLWCRPQSRRCWTQRPSEKQLCKLRMQDLLSIAFSLRKSRKLQERGFKTMSWRSWWIRTSRELRRRVLLSWLQLKLLRSDRNQPWPWFVMMTIRTNSILRTSDQENSTNWC